MLRRWGKSGVKTMLHLAFARYVSSGHILYAQSSGTILAVPFDLDSRTIEGDVFAVASGVEVSGWGGGAALDVSDAGTLAFVAGSV